MESAPVTRGMGGNRTGPVSAAAGCGSGAGASAGFETAGPGVQATIERTPTAIHREMANRVTEYQPLTYRDGGTTGMSATYFDRRCCAKPPGTIRGCSFAIYVAISRPLGSGER